ncbi:MAG: hypothetical protein FJX75_13510 [Armatimonadetes bacterium]|nr:hypothetical protein [Armatimonadota bacterium]
MPRAGRAAKPGGKSGLVIGIIVVVLILAGLGVAGYFYNRSSAVSTATQFMDVITGSFKTGELDTATLKRILVKDQASEVDKALGPLGAMANNPLAKQWLSQMQAQASYKMGEVQADLKEASVAVTLTVSMMGQSQSIPMKVILVREGLAWKVDAGKTQTSVPGVGGAGGGAPKL